MHGYCMGYNMHEYTIKSGYDVAKEKKENKRVSDPRSSYVITESMWKCIWKLAVLAKIQNFLWRIESGAVATNETLAKRFGGKDLVCPVCEEENDTLEHLLFLCPWANKCWHGSELDVRFSKLKM